jgi:hypothetical protein
MLKRVSFFEWHHLASARGGRGVIAEIEMNSNANDSKGECWSNQDETKYVDIGPASGLSQDPHTREGRREALEQMEKAKAEQLGVQEHLRAQEHERRTALESVLDRAQAERDLAHLHAGQRVRPLSTPSESQTSSKRLPPEPAPENHNYDVGSGTARERDQEQRRLFRAVSAAQQQLEEAQHEVEEAQQLLEVGHPQIKRKFENFSQPANEEKERLKTGIVSGVVKGNGERDGRYGPRDMSGMSRQEWALKKMEAKREFEHDEGNEAGAGGTDFQKCYIT